MLVKHQILNQHVKRWSPTAATFYFYNSFCSVLRSQALETLQLSFRELNGRKSCWNWPGSAPKPWNLLRNPVELDLPLHQSLPDLLRNLLRSPVEPDLAAPKPPRPSPGTFSRTFSRTLLNLTWLCTKTSQTFSGTFGTFSGTSLNLTRHLHQCTPELFWAEDPVSLRCWGKISANIMTPRHNSRILIYCWFNSPSVLCCWFHVISTTLSFCCFNWVTGFRIA